MPFINDFRPSTFDQVVGHDNEIKVLKRKLSNNNHPHSYLLCGGSGLGKTTIGRIIANTILAEIIEFDAGKITGVDSIRELLDSVKYMGIGKYKNKCFIIDECHMLSKSSWNALLKTIEEPPKHVYFVFCTTEINKIPKTIQTRCLDIKLTPVNSNEIYDLLKSTKVVIDDKYINLISKNCDGSPRNALSLLEKAVELDDVKDFKQIVSNSDEDGISENVLSICRMLAKNEINNKVLIQNFKNITDYEGARIQIFNYLTSVVMNQPKVSFLFERLSCFGEPIKMQQTSKGELLLKILTAIEE